MMREPTSVAQALRWHRKAMEQINMRLQHEVINDDPQPGWFEVRMVKGGPMLPARIWLEADVDDAGDLMDSETLRCQVVYVEHDPMKMWSRLSHRPISRERYDFLIAVGDWTAEWQPNSPLNDPFKRIEARDIPIPTFA